MNRSTAGLSVRSFSEKTAKGQGRTGSSTGNIFTAERAATDRGIAPMNRPVRRKWARSDTEWVSKATRAQFVALAKSRPQEIFVGTNGTGTLPNFAGLAIARTGNIPITVIPYGQGGTVAAITDIMGGRVHATIEAVAGLRGQLQSGDLKLIGEKPADLPVQQSTKVELII